MKHFLNTIILVPARTMKKSSAVTSLPFSKIVHVDGWGTSSSSFWWYYLDMIIAVVIASSTSTTNPSTICMHFLKKYGCFDSLIQRKRIQWESICDEDVSIIQSVLPFIHRDSNRTWWHMIDKSGATCVWEKMQDTVESHSFPFLNLIVVPFTAVITHSYSGRRYRCCGGGGAVFG